MWKVLNVAMLQSCKVAKCTHLSNYIVHTRKITPFRLVSWRLGKRLAITVSLHSFEAVICGL